MRPAPTALAALTPFRAGLERMSGRCPARAGSPNHHHVAGLSPRTEIRLGTRALTALFLLVFRRQAL